LNIRSAKLQILCILYATISSTQIYSAQRQQDLPCKNCKALTMMDAKHKLTITNNCPYSIKLKPNESFMPEYFLPNETSILKGDVVKIAIALLANQWSNSFDVPSTTASIIITEKNLEFVTDSKIVIARFPLNK
jgi:hypothetical protein